MPDPLLPPSPIELEIQRRLVEEENARRALAGLAPAPVETQPPIRMRPRAPRPSAVWGGVTPETRINPLAIMNAPSAALGATMGNLLEQSPDVMRGGSPDFTRALGAGATEAMRAPTVTSVTEQTSPSQEAAKHGVDLGTTGSLWTDLMLDPTNLFGGDAATDVLKLGMATVPRALKKLPSLAKEPTAVVTAAKALFPRLDAYTKPVGPISRATMLKRIEAATDLTPEVKTALTGIAEQASARRMMPAEIHALAAGETYKPERVLRKVKAPVEGEKQIVGAPLGVTNARQEAALRERYMKGMERGVRGRNWYEDAGKAILFHANEDPERAMLLASDMAITSPTTSVGANTGFGVKGYNQAIAGVPVAAGRYPTAMGKSIETLHGGGEGSLGLKRDPFAQNVARGGGFLEKDLPSRAVHDIWDAELWGYVNPDATPMRSGFGPAQHRWMDTQQDKMLAAANARAVAGFTDWNDLRSQAAGWTGAQIGAGRLDPSDAAKDYSDFFAPLYAQGSREFTPGATTGHLPELLAPEMGAERQLLHEIMLRESGIFDPQMRDQIAAGFGGLVGRSFEGPGYFKGRASPGIQTQVLTGSLEAPGGRPGERVLDEGSRRIMDAAEATHGLLAGQDAWAYSRLLPAGSGGTRTGWDIALPGGTIRPEQMEQLIPLLGETGLVPIPTPTGVRLGDPSGAGTDPKQLKAIVKAMGGTVEDAAAFRGGYGEPDWPNRRGIGSADLAPIRTLATGPQDFDKFAPALAENVRKADAFFRKETGGRFTLSAALDEVRGTIANEGWAGLERLAKKYGIPVMVLAAGLKEAGMNAPPAPGQEMQ